MTWDSNLYMLLQGYANKVFKHVYAITYHGQECRKSDCNKKQQEAQKILLQKVF